MKEKRATTLNISNSGFCRFSGGSGSNQPRQICRFDYLDKVQLWLLSNLIRNRFKVRYCSYYYRYAQALLTTKNKIFLIFILATTAILIMGTILFINNFKMFDEPTKEIIKTECDYEGLRQATIFTLTGNATTNPSIHISMELGCDKNDEQKISNVLFTADNGRINGNEVDIRWTTLDTLTVFFDSNIRIFKKESLMKFGDSTMNFAINYIEK